MKIILETIGSGAIGAERLDDVVWELHKAIQSSDSTPQFVATVLAIFELSNEWSIHESAKHYGEIRAAISSAIDAICDREDAKT